jgi:hypothetical protein
MTARGSAMTLATQTPGVTPPDQLTSAPFCADRASAPAQRHWPVSAGPRPLKTYPGFPHGMLTTHADVLNPDLLAFIQS